MNALYHGMGDPDNDFRKKYIGGDKDTVLQIAISIPVGLLAFLVFCVCDMLQTG